MDGHLDTIADVADTASAERALELAIQSYTEAPLETEKIIERAKAFDDFLTRKRAD